MQKIKLTKGVWDFDEGIPLGPKGGFGRVFDCPSGVAIKKLYVSAMEAKRELTLAEALAGQSFQHVVPVHDAGEDAETGGFYIVMAKCETSLAHFIEANAPLPITESLGILRDIASGLQEVGAIVHRDLKPANVLLHDGTWKLADFGVAKFVEDTTSLNTMRDCLTPPFAAPEQWRNEHASKATDVYALGCIAHVVLTGAPPFAAVDLAGWQRAHLTLDPKPLPETVPPKLKSLVALMLRKSPEVRPSLDRVLATLAAILEGTKEGAKRTGSLLSTVDAEISAQNAQFEAENYAREQQAKRNNLIALEGAKDFYAIKTELFSAIASEAANAIPHAWQIDLAQATLRLDEAAKTCPNGKCAGVGKWTIYTASTIWVTQRVPNEYIWGASLWFGTNGHSKDCRWYQLSFMANPLSQRTVKYQPFGAPPDSPEALGALSDGVAITQLAETPRAIDGDGLEDFIDEWLERFGLAAAGRLKHPSILPLSPRE
jgi:serine/threonine-protein kinase